MKTMMTAIVIGATWVGLGSVGAAPVVPASLPATAPATLPARSYEERLREELDALVRSAVRRPYGWGFSRGVGGAPGAEATGGVGGVSFEAGDTPGAGLVLHLSGRLLAEPAYGEAAHQVARMISAAMDTTGRVPGEATANPTGLFNREPKGFVPRREPNTASLGFLLLLDRDLRGGSDAHAGRVASTALRSAHWLIKQQTRAGVFPSPIETGDSGGAKFTRRIGRLDTADLRDSIVALLMVRRMAEGGNSLPGSTARAAADKAVGLLLKQRFNEVGRPSRHLWPPGWDLAEGVPLKGVASMPPTGDFLATRYALEALLAYHLERGDEDSLEALRLGAEAVERRRSDAGDWPRMEDPRGAFPPPKEMSQSDPAMQTAPQWVRGTFGLPDTLKSLADLRALGRDTFGKLAARTQPMEDWYGAILAGLTERFPTADLPLSRAQIGPFLEANPELSAMIAGDPPAELSGRVRRLYVLYLLASWERRFATPATGTPSSGGATR